MAGVLVVGAVDHQWVGGAWSVGVRVRVGCPFRWLPAGLPPFVVRMLCAWHTCAPALFCALDLAVDLEFYVR
jgi:hypothetical protein